MKRVLVAVISALGMLSCATGPSPEQGMVERAVQAMGGAERLASIKTIATKGTAKHWDSEQSDVPGGAMRFTHESSYDMVCDVAARSARIDWQRNYVYVAQRTFTYREIVTPEAGYIIGVPGNSRNAQNMKSNPPANSMSSYRLATAQRELRRALPVLLLEMRADPQAVQPAADVVADNRSYPALKYREFIVAFDPQSGLPARVRTLDYDAIWGDVDYDLVFGQWRDFGGVRLPISRKHERNGRVVSDGVLSDVQINAPIASGQLEIPAQIRAAAAKPATADVPYQWVIQRVDSAFYSDSEHLSYDTAASPGLRLQQLAPGVDHVVGGSHNSMLVEMRDHLIVFDAPISDQQSRWVVDAAKAKYPGKPIRYVVLTHHHNDHTSGLRGFLIEGATLVVGRGAGAHFNRVLSSPWTRNPYIKARDLSRTQIVEVTDKYVMTDGTRRVEAYPVDDNPHAKGMLIGFVPDAKLGFVTDIWSPGPPLPAKPNPGLVAVVNAVKKANIQPERFAGGHGSSADYAGLARLAGQ